MNGILEWEISEEKQNVHIKSEKQGISEKRVEKLPYLRHGFKNLGQPFCPPPSGFSLGEGQCPEKTELEREKENMKCWACPHLPASPA